jgi:hypothetical protein
MKTLRPGRIIAMASAPLRWLAMYLSAQYRFSAISYPFLVLEIRERLNLEPIVY